MVHQRDKVGTVLEITQRNVFLAFPRGIFALSNVKKFGRESQILWEKELFSAWGKMRRGRSPLLCFHAMWTPSIMKSE